MNIGLYTKKTKKIWNYSQALFCYGEHFMLYCIHNHPANPKEQSGEGG